MSRYLTDTLKVWLTPNGQHEPRMIPLARFSVEWCDQCDTFFVRCPRCGNNSCNGGYGEEDERGSGTCPVCPLAYELSKAIDSAFRTHEASIDACHREQDVWRDLDEQRDAALRGDV